MENIIQVCIYIHVIFGIAALVFGLMSIAFKKGTKFHKKAGKIFYYTMLFSATIAMIIAVLPNHYNIFLFAMGIFSLYFVLSGYRAIRFKQEHPDLKIDKWIARIMISTGVLMIVIPILFFKKINILLFVFGSVGLFFSIRDLQLFKNPQRLQESGLKLHLGKMLGAYICATTAFVVVNQFISSIYAWFVPGIIGGFIIVYWIRRVNKKQLHNRLK